MAEFFTDTVQFILAAGSVHLAACHLFLQIIYLCQITDVGDNHGNIIFLIKNRGAGDQRLLAGLELLMQGDRVPLLDGEERTGYGNDIPLHQVAHIAAHDF